MMMMGGGEIFCSGALAESLAPSSGEGLAFLQNDIDGLVSFVAC